MIMETILTKDLRLIGWNEWVANTIKAVLHDRDCGESENKNYNHISLIEKTV